MSDSPILYWISYNKVGWRVHQLICLLRLTGIPGNLPCKADGYTRWYAFWGWRVYQVICLWGWRVHQLIFHLRLTGTPDDHLVYPSASKGRSSGVPLSLKRQITWCTRQPRLTGIPGDLPFEADWHIRWSAFWGWLVYQVICLVRLTDTTGDLSFEADG
jgi:hypothetical protein